MCSRKFSQLLATAFCMAMILPIFSATPVSANSAPAWFSGVDSAGAVLTGDDCPIIVEKERLTFDIQDFPQSYYKTKEDFLSYSSKVTAEYTFYNPTDYKVTAKLLFPFGNFPSYGIFYDNDAEEYVVGKDTDKYNVTVNGEMIEKQLRHTLSSVSNEFELENDLAKLIDGYVEDDFYSPDMPVTKYTYSISDIDLETYPAANVAFDISSSDTKTKIFFVNNSGIRTLDDDTTRYSAWATAGETLTLYAIGNPFTQDLTWSIYKNGGLEDREKIQGSVKLTATDTMTFLDFALMDYSENSGILASDWYNAVVLLMKTNEQETGMISSEEKISFNLNLNNSLMRWYEYEITLDPGERIVNAVTAPIYPAIDENWEPALHEYTYLLSPAKKWAEFGTLDIVINTPYHITDSALGEFTETQNGYQQSFTGLPDGELSFTLCSADNPDYSPQTDTRPFSTLLRFTGIVILCVIAGIIAGVFISKKKGRNRLA